MSPDELLGLGFSKQLVVFAIAALPISELRGAIPWAIIKLDYPWYHAFLLAIAGNLFPVPFILLFFNSIARLLSKVNLFNQTLSWVTEHTKRRGKIIERYERIGLVLFVAIPLPITGAWTGSLAAVLFGLKFKHALLSIFIGICVAGIIVTCTTLFGWALFGLIEAQ